MRKRLMACAVAAMAVTATGHARAASYTLGVSVPTADHGWAGGIIFQAERVAKLLEAEHPGLRVIVKTSADPVSQANALEDLTTEGMDALVILPIDPNPLVNAIKEVKSHGTFVGLVDRSPSVNDSTVRNFYIAGDNYGLGAAAGEYIKAHNPDAKVAVIRGLPIPIDQERQNGFDNAIKGSNIDILAKQYGNWSRDDAFKVMQDYLTKFQHIDVVWCQDDDMGVGVLQAIKQSKRTDIKYIIGGAGSKQFIKKVMDDDKMVPVDILYPDTMVATAMEITVAHLYDKVTVAGTYKLDATLVTPQNAKDYYFPDSPF
ncbi:substrate-binding domain-containing protein [Acidisoma sp.]|uniref:substrate-binding domain-containing protein n=1 Tax=Acidisoma sp. TaxID=1872115 RepID=UPI003AFFA087